MTHLGLPQSDDTVLRNLKRHVAERRKGTATRVVGIDDWAWQKGCRYGTIMVDLEQREVVDVLSDRSAVGTARWLRQHPGLEIISRDRCGLYAKGARRGAPQARQVAGRFHLLQNLRQTIEQLLSRAPRSPGPALTHIAAAEPFATGAGSAGRLPALAEHQQLARAGRRAILTGMFDRVKALQVAGNGICAIVRQTGFNWRTVAKWARLDELPPRNVMAPKPTTPRSFENHLSRRWTEGCTSGRSLLPEIKNLGYTGSLSHLERLLSRWRQAGRPIVAGTCPPARSVLIYPSTGHLASPIIAAALCVKSRGLLTKAQAAKVDALVGRLRHHARTGDAVSWYRPRC